MKKINIRKIFYAIRHKYMTLNNVVILVAFLIAASWVWGSLGMMQRNYSLQKEVDYKKRQLALTELQKDKLDLQKRYYQTAEYQELAVRDNLGLVRPGEKVLILPPNSDAAKNADVSSSNVVVPPTRVSNMEQWINFLFGGYSQSISGNDQKT